MQSEYSRAYHKCEIDYYICTVSILVYGEIDKMTFMVSFSVFHVFTLLYTL